MNRRQIEKLKRSFAARGGAFEIADDTPPEITLSFLERLIGCPECRAVILQACNPENRKDVDIDTVLRDLARADGH